MTHLDLIPECVASSQIHNLTSRCGAACVKLSMTSQSGDSGRSGVIQQNPQRTTPLVIIDGLLWEQEPVGPPLEYLDTTPSYVYAVLPLSRGSGSQGGAGV